MAGGLLIRSGSSGLGCAWQPRGGEAYRFTFYDSFGNVHRSRLEIEGDVIRWTGDWARCTITMSGDGMTQVARRGPAHADGVSWTASIDVTLRKVG